MAVSVRETLEFLDTLFRNKLSEAERVLQQLEEKHPDDKRYLHALRGIYISYTGDDKDSLLFVIYTNPELNKMVKKIRSDMERLAGFWGQGDRYFEAWKTFLESLGKLPKPAKLEATQGH
jgi:hypothetical protein